MISVGTSSVRRKISIACAKRSRIVGVADALHVPAIGEEARRDVVAEGEIGVAFDRHAVAVVDPAKVAEHLVAGERGRFARHALHHVAVAAYRVNVVVEDREIRPVEMLRQPAPGDRHADAVAAALAERAGRRLDARGQVIFRMAGAFAAELAEPLDVVERDRGLAETLVFGIDGLHAGEMQERVEQHRGMAVGQHEAVAIGPDRIVRIEAQKMLPERVGHRRQRHRRAGMAGIGLLHGVHRQGADGVDAELVDRCVGNAKSFPGRKACDRVRWHLMYGKRPAESRPPRVNRNTRLEVPSPDLHYTFRGLIARSQRQQCISDEEPRVRLWRVRRSRTTPSQAACAKLTAPVEVLAPASPRPFRLA